MNSFSVHDEWLSLIEISGPFLAIPVLKEVFPQGLEELDALKRKRLRQAYEEWCEALETDDPQFLELHAAWIDEVLSRGLELDESGTGDTLKRGDQVPASLSVTLPEHGVTLAPDLAVVDTSHTDLPLMLIHTYAADVDLEGSIKQDGWAVSPAERMVQLCRVTGCRIGLITNGERWMLVDAPVGAVTTFASWYARIWSQEPITLQAFVHLLGIRRFFIDKSEQLPALFDRSLKYQDEVTEALGEQVRRAVEVLIQSLDKADQDRNRELLRDVAPTVLYEAGLTVMMRLVFLLCAEERGLLLMGDECYEENYALSTLRMQLRKESEEILERRWDAWSRLLAIFRAVFGGIEHESLRLPALGGSLFDPDRFPFLEGRAKGSKWRTDIAKPLPIDNRTVLLLLEAIQQFQGRTLSYRALDVEQIGYVYEGLLERTVKRTDEVTLELDATKNAKTPWVELGELESAKLDGVDRLAELLIERSGSSASRVRNDLAKTVDDTLADHLLAACQGDLALRDRIRPYAHLLRIDPWGYPLVYPKGAFIVTTGSDRRETGAHYTPKSLTEAIVTETLTPVVYIGPAEGKPREEWVLKSPAELLDLKICDPAMGSGAFLVQVCRLLSERLVEAWSAVEATGKFVTIDGKVLVNKNEELLPRDAEARTVIARRLIAERCIYGVDLNPLAVELAKLSIWLVTLAKGRPFGFLDHNLRCGDSLLGIHRLDQLTELSMTPGGKGQQRLFGKNIEKTVLEAIELRQRLREMRILDIHDVEAMARLDADARRLLEVPERIADSFIGEVFAASGNASVLENGLATLAIQAEQAVEGDPDAIGAVIVRARTTLSVDLPTGRPSRLPFHWPLEFPEVFKKVDPGFNAVLGNPPFLGGRRISSAFGEAYERAIKQIGLGNAKGSINFVLYFILRGIRCLRANGAAGFLATDSITENETREVGLAEAFKLAPPYCAKSSFPWPGKAGVYVSILHFWRGEWAGRKQLDGVDVSSITTMLEPGNELSTPLRLKLNTPFCSDGVKVQGIGFVLDEQEAMQIIGDEPNAEEVVTRYVVGDDINTDPRHIGKRWVINFWKRSDLESQQYVTPWKIVTERVKPYRDSLTKQVHEDCFWKFWDRREAFFDRVRSKGRALVCSKLSKHFAVVFGDPQFIYSEKAKVFDFQSYSAFCVLQSTIHSSWSLVWGSTTGETPAYVGSSCFDTFPFPSVLTGDGVPESTFELDYLKDIGERYYLLREKTIAESGKGLTALYNRFHSSSDQSAEISALREVHTEMDVAVLRAYGWADIHPEHQSIQTRYGVRFTLSESSRVEILHRLINLNSQRYAEEVARGLHGKTSSSRNSASDRALRSLAPQQGLDFEELSVNKKENKNG